MHKLRNNEKGFGAVEGLLIVAVVALLGVVGYMVYKNHNKATNTSNVTARTPTPTPTPTPTTQTTTKPTQSQTPTTVKLSADHYSFTAPYGWAIVSPKPQLGNDFKDSKGNTLHVEERYSSSGGGAYGTITADSIWLVKNDSNQGVTVQSKSPACTSGTTTFEQLRYTCDSDANTTKVAAFMQAQAGEVLVNGRLYVLEFTNSNSGSADTSVFQNILSTFIGDAR